MITKPEELNEYKESPPPFLGKWRNVYLAVLLNLGFIVLLFYIFTKVFE